MLGAIKYCWKIGANEDKYTLKKIKSGKAVQSNDIPSENWKLIWWVLEKKEVSNRYIDMIKNMYDRVVWVRIMKGKTNCFYHYRFTSKGWF